MLLVEVYRGYLGFELFVEFYVLYIDFWKDIGVDMNKYRVKIGIVVVIVLKVERDRNIWCGIKELVFR